MEALLTEEFNTSTKYCTDVESQYTIFHGTLLNQTKKDFNTNFIQPLRKIEWDS